MWETNKDRDYLRGTGNKDGNGDNGHKVNAEKNMMPI